MNLYLFRCENFMKVGVSDNPEFRLAQINSASPLDTYIEKSIKMPNRSLAFDFEKMLHERLKQLGLHIKNEWFRYARLDFDEQALICLKVINAKKKKTKKSKIMQIEERVEKQIIARLTARNLIDKCRKIRSRMALDDSRQRTLKKLDRIEQSLILVIDSNAHQRILVEAKIKLEKMEAK